MFRDLIPSSKRTLSRPGSDPVVSLRKAVDSLFDGFTDDFADVMPTAWGSSSLGSFSPKLDLEDKDDRIILSAELPGLTEKDVQVEMNKDYLTIKGEKKTGREEKNKNRYVCERSYGAFERTIQLPSDINRDKIDASVKDGVLTVTIPKSSDAKKDVKTIPVHH